MSEISIYLLRHGELVKSGILCGRTDIELSERGKQQLIDATSKLPIISHCFSSPLIRCQVFAQQFCQQQQIPLQVIEQLAEMNFGDWDGEDYQTLWQQNAKLAGAIHSLGDFWQNPWQCSPPNGETMTDFAVRVDAIWQLLLKQGVSVSQDSEKPQNFLVISHGGVIRYILAKILNLPLPGTSHMTQIDVPYGALIHIKIFVDNNGKAWPKLML